MLAASRHNPLPLRLVDQGEGKAHLVLGDIDITGAVARDGLTIEYVGDLGPVVTIRFIPRGVALNLDIDLLRKLLAAAERGA